MPKLGGHFTTFTYEGETTVTADYWEFLNSRLFNESFIKTVEQVREQSPSGGAVIIVRNRGVYQAYMSAQMTLELIHLKVAVITSDGKAVFKLSDFPTLKLY